MCRRPVQNPAHAAPTTKRTESAGKFAAVLGVGGVVFSAFSLAIIAAQRTLLASLDGGAQGRDAAAHAMHVAAGAIHGLYFRHVPIWLALSAVLILAGRAVRRGSATGVRILRVACVLAIAEVVAYVAHAIAGPLPPFVRAVDESTHIGTGIAWVFGGASVLVGVIFAAPFGWILRNARTGSSSSEPQEAEQ